MTGKPEVNCCYQAWVLKNSVTRRAFGCGEVAASLSFTLLLGSDCWSRCHRRTEVAHESLEVLRRRCQEKLLPDKFQSTQAQTTQSDLILQFREQSLDFLSLPLCRRKFRSVRQLSCALPRRLMDVNGEVLISAIGTLRFLRAGSAAFRAADIGMGTIANVQSDIVQLLAGR